MLPSPDRPIQMRNNDRVGFFFFFFWQADENQSLGEEFAKIIIFIFEPKKALVAICVLNCIPPEVFPI